MQATAEDTILLKTKELCESIVNEPHFRKLRERIDAFMADEGAVAQYQKVAEKNEMLQHKQQMGAALNNDEVQDFEKHREALVNNPVAREFMEARQEMQQVHQTINEYVSKTLELGRLPTEEDMGGGGCGHSCGCHH